MKKILILIGVSLFTGICQAQLSFSESAQTLGSAGFACLSGDLNNDGNLDIYIVKRDKSDEIWFNDGKGVFTISGQKIGNAVKYNQNAALADLNGDGILDIFIANDADWNHTPSVGLPNEVWLNDGKGKFTDSGQRLGNEASHDLALGDVDGDGDIDAVIANLHSTDLTNITYQNNEVWTNDGKGIFTKSAQKLGTGSFIAKLANLDGDTDLDVVIQNQVDNSFVIWFNDGKGNFTQSVKTDGIGTNLAFGDVDGDGDKDAFVVKGTRDASAPCEVWLNDGTGLFANSNQSLGNKTGYFVDLVDVDVDGDLDAMVTNGLKDTQASSLWINQGGKQSSTPGTFIESGIVFSATQIGNVNSGDFDKDGDMDIVISNYAGTNKIYFNNTIITGINNIENKISIFPNPTTGLVNVSFGNSLKKVLVEVYNLQGTQVFSKTFQNTPSATIDLTGNSAGIYVVKVIADGACYEEKIVKVIMATKMKTTMKKLLLITATIILMQICNAQVDSLFFGQTPPGNTPVIFAPGVISTTGYNEHTLSVSPDGNEIYFTRDPSKNTLIVKRNNGIWSSPATASFTGREALLSPDGSKLFYNNGDIWYVENSGTNWSSPTKLDTAINTIAHEYYASVSNDGTLYFSRIDADNAHIYESKLENGHYASAKRLPSSINQNSCNNYHSFVSPGGDFILFNSNRAGGFGGADIYICFKKANGDWGNAVNLGSEINSTLYDLCPVLSPNSKYIFFTRYNSGNGEGEIYWVSSSIIDSLKKTANTTILNINKEQNLRINPNPTNGRITLSLGTSQNREALVEIYNLHGAQVFSKTFKNTPSATIDLTGHSAGIYVVKVIADGVSYEKKILKE